MNEKIEKCTMISILLVGFIIEMYIYNYLNSFTLFTLQDIHYFKFNFHGLFIIN